MNLVGIVGINFPGLDVCVEIVTAAHSLLDGDEPEQLARDFILAVADDTTERTATPGLNLGLHPKGEVDGESHGNAAAGMCRNVEIFGNGKVIAYRPALGSCGLFKRVRERLYLKLSAFDCF